MQIEAAVAERLVGPYTWLLERVGDAGITLTGAGYLPPAEVEAAVAALGLAREWIGKGNRENQTQPVLDLRESAQKLGLLRKHKGTLAVTTQGRRVRADPLALWWHLAERMPVTSADPITKQAGLLLLIAVAAGAADDLNDTIADLLGAIGWISDDGTPMTPLMASHAAWDNAAVLRWLGTLEPSRSERERGVGGISLCPRCPGHLAGRTPVT